MEPGILIHYAKQSAPPAFRASVFIAAEERLTWVSIFLSDFPDADVYLVGGTLRDVLLGLTPRDIDLVIRGVEIKKLKSWFGTNGAYKFVGTRFGTFKFTPHGQTNRQPIDIALPRKEMVGEDHNSARTDLEILVDPHLRIEEDLSRRDFTINALAYNVAEEVVIDPFGGLFDLDAKLIQAVEDANERFFEDATRMLRALRFSSTLGFGIEEKTWNAIKHFIHLLDGTTMTEEGTHRYVIPREGIGKEFLLGFLAHPVHALRLWKEAGALKMFLKEAAGLEHIIESGGGSRQDYLENLMNALHRGTLLEMHGYHSSPANVFVAALISAFEGEASSIRLCRDFYLHQFPNSHPAHVDCRQVGWLVEHINDFEEVDPATIRPSVFEKQFMNERGRQLLLLMHAKCIASGMHGAERERLHIARMMLSQFSKRIAPNGVSLPHLVTGADIESMGLVPGPVYRTLIDQVRDEQLMQKIHTTEEALDLLRILVADAST
jgi:tRNA nucleotidyltransferase/poly(A) polymerase